MKKLSRRSFLALSGSAALLIAVNPFDCGKSFNGKCRNHRARTKVLLCCTHR